MNIELDIEIVQTAAAELQDQLKTRADLILESDAESQVLRTPDIKEIATHLQFENDNEGFISGKTTSRESLQVLEGARAIVSFRAGNGALHAPGVVLADGRLAVLTTKGRDVVEDPNELEVLSDMQQLLLASALARQADGVGISHDSGLVEVGHATMVAVAENPLQIHGNTHRIAKAGNFATQIANRTTIEMGSDARPTGTAIIEPSDAMFITFTDKLQAPLPIDDPFEASAGFASMAVQSQANSNVNVLKNIEGMATNFAEHN